jgi:hypothetical protein
MKAELKPIGEASRKLGRLRMVLMIDEAKYLVGLKFYNAFRWIIDQVIEPAWLLARPKNECRPLPFMVFFLGTNSKIADFLPPDEDSSARYFFEFMKVPPPFTALDWDITVSTDSVLHYTSLNYESLAEMTWLCRFGRPYWQAQWGSTLTQSSSKSSNAISIVTAAENRLHQQNSRKGYMKLFQNDKSPELQTARQREAFILTCSAILGVLAVLHLDFTSPKRAADLVASRLRWVVGCDRKRTYLLTTYPSEPVLAEAAFRLLFTKTENDRDADKILKRILNVVAAEVEKGDYDVGGDGELVGRLLCTLSSMRCANTAGLLARRHALELTYPEINIDTMLPSARGDPLLYSHRPTPVTTFLRCLFADIWVEAIKHVSPNIWQTLENSYVNFSHFTEEICHKDAHDSLTVEGLLALYFRGCAIQCRQGQAGIDMVIPMVVLPDNETIYSPVSISHMSAIIFQIKNKKKDSAPFTEEFIASSAFDIRHIHRLSATESRPYIGIWMSFGTDLVDFCIEGCEEPFRRNCKYSLASIGTKYSGKGPIQVDLRVQPSRAAKKRDAEEQSTSPPSKKPRRVNTPTSRLNFRARGFNGIYNKAMPLDILDRFIDRHRYSTSTGGLHFPTELIRRKAMRSAWKLSTSDTVSSFLSGFGRLSLDDSSLRGAESLAPTES